MSSKKGTVDDKKVCCKICNKEFKNLNHERICKTHTKSERVAYFAALRRMVVDNREIVFLMLSKQEVREINDLKNKVLYEKPLVLK